jgi:hypothetical protein
MYTQTIKITPGIHLLKVHTLRLVSSNHQHFHD